MKDENLWIRDNWDQGKGRSISIKIKEVLESYRSEYQKIDVYDTVCFGKLLMLDDIIMMTEADEFSYHEMISHIALHVHPKPRKVLIIGGGDGGTMREVLKHDIEEVHLCEIDPEVVSVSKKHFPKIASGFDDPRSKIIYDDGAKYVKNNRGVFDIIIVDSTDPIGPAEVLFKEEFYRSMHDSLTDDGIAITQSESMFYDRNLISELFNFNRKIFSVVGYYYTMVPTYPSGTIGFSFCSKKYEPVKDMIQKNIPGLRYYTPDIHRSSFVLPAFMKDII